jgi:hypothetical protein
MRETCARVLAAALMTGAIAFALAMPAVLGTARENGRPLTAPPSSLQRSVRVTTSALSSQPNAVASQATTRELGAAAALAALRSRLASRGSESTTLRPESSGRTAPSRPTPPPKPTPTPTPTPAPAPQPPTRELAAETAPPAATATPPPTTDSGHGKGKGKGKDKARVKGAKASHGDESGDCAPAATQPTPPAAAPAAVPGAPPAPEADNGGGKDHGHGKGGDKGHDD